GAAFAAIEVNSNAATTITNSVGGVIAPTSGSSAKLAILATSTGNGAFTINNDGTLTGRVSLTDNPDVLNNTGIWNVTGTSNFFAGGDIIDNMPTGVINAGTTAASITN